MTIAEFIHPIFYCLGYFLIFGVFTTPGTALDAYFKSEEFFCFVFYLGVVTLTFISHVGFINFQLPKEYENNVAS